MKRSFKAVFLLTIALFFQQIVVTAQSKKSTIPHKGYWVIVSNIHEKKKATIQFYTDQNELIGEEVVVIKLNPDRRKTRYRLKAGLEKALLAWNEKQKTIRDKQSMAVLENK